MCWHQGEAEGNLTDMSAEEYRAHFLSILGGVRASGFDAPVYVATATLAGPGHPFNNRAQIRAAQQGLVSPRDKVFAGPDTDRIGLEHRSDGVHFSASGLDLHAEAWCEALAAGPLR
jgi:hypothetical protein